MDPIAGIDALLGQEAHAWDLGAGQTVLRALVVYVVTLTIVRLGKKRFMGRGTAFDVIVGIIVGSVASRAITGNAPLVPSMAGVATLLALHWLFSAISLRWHGFGRLVKGRTRTLVRDGEMIDAAMRSAHLTKQDLDEDLRSKGWVPIEDVAEARLERSGNVSLRRRGSGPRIVEIDVAEGVQRVRVEFD